MKNYGRSARVKKLWLAVMLVVTGAIVVSSVGAKPADSPATAQRAFKNVQVLKDIPADDLVPAMQFITASLGVGCDFCHVRDGFEKDDKPPKKVARKMIEMVMALNQNNFQGQRAVTCYSCHHGGRAPVSVPPVGKVSPDPDMPYFSEVVPEDLPLRAGENLPPSAAILAKFIAVSGGRSAIENISSRVESGTVSFDSGPPFPVEIATKAPDKQILTVHMPSGDSVTAFNGEKGWLRFPGSPAREMHRANLPGAKLDAELHFPLEIRAMFSNFKAVQRSQIEGSEAILVFASNPGEPPVELYFDAVSGALLREVRFAESPLGLNPTRIDYADYSAFDGVMVPLHVTIAGPNRQVEMKFDHVEQNIAIPDSKFERQ